MSQGVYVLGGKCLGWGKCPRGKCPGGLCPWGKCPGGTSPGGLCPRTSPHRAVPPVPTFTATAIILHCSVSTQDWIWYTPGSMSPCPMAQKNYSKYLIQGLSSLGYMFRKYISRIS